MKETKFQERMYFKRFVSALALVFFMTSFVSAQIKTVSGVVKDASGETIIGASVTVKGTKSATITDIDGKYKLNIPADGKTLVASYIGMESQEVAIKASVVNITLQPVDKSLDEVVVIGYGTQRKRDLTGSLSTVGEKELKDIPVSTVAEALTGKMPGVQVTTTEGSPDADIKIRVRGGGSITQSNTPLYVVDGFIKDDIKDIAPSEIIECTVLKDASTTAIYGARGANGVMIITTKSGSQGKLSVSYNAYFGIKQVSKYLDVLSPFQFAQKQYERAVWGNTVAADYETYFGSFNDINLYNSMNATNWQKESFGRMGSTQNHSVTVSGGSKLLTFNLNYNHMDDKAIMAMSDYRRDNIAAKVNINPIQWLKIDLAARYAGTVIDGGGANDQTGSEKSTADSRIKNAVTYTPIPLKNLVLQDDNVDAVSSLYSPLQTIADNDRYQNTKTFTFNGGFTVNINKNLVFKSNLGYITTSKVDNRFWGLSSYYVLNGGATKLNNASAPAVTLNDINTSKFQATNLLTFTKKDLFKDQNLTVMVGEENSSTSYDIYSRNYEALPPSYNSRQAWDSTRNGVLKLPNHYYAPDDRLLSFFGRVNYDILDRYLIAVTMRADGSSKFMNENHWGYFPSASIGWRITEESFMKSQDWVSNLKLRGSLGESGNNNIPLASFWRNYSISSNNYLPNSMQTNYFVAGGSSNILANNDLRWETTITRGLGLDYGFFKNRINGSIDVYSNITTGVLIPMLLSGVGYTSQWQNVGQTSNRGAEINLNAVLVQSKDFNLTLGINFSTNINNVDNLGSLTSYSFNEAWTSSTLASNSYFVTPGQPVGIIYGFKTIGMYSADDFAWNGTHWIMNAAKYTLDPATNLYKDANGNTFVDNSAITGLSWGPGAMKIQDVDGDGKITLADRQKIGDTNPKHYGSFSISGNYKGFDFSTNINWVYGNNIYNASKIEMSSLYYKDRNMLASTANAYTQIDWTTGNRVTDTSLLSTMNANATIWATPTNNYALTSWAIEDGSFIRLNNLTLGYTFPSKLTKKFYVQKLRLYATGNNLFILTNYSGYDPEVDTRRTTPATPGVDFSAYPKSRSYNIGLNITF